ncbi:MAG: hypothetical protein ACYCZQ_13325 [Burkholderiales bacterium]
MTRYLRTIDRITRTQQGFSELFGLLPLAASGIDRLKLLSIGKTRQRNLLEIKVHPAALLIKQHQRPRITIAKIVVERLGGAKQRSLEDAALDAPHW